MPIQPLKSMNYLLFGLCLIILSTRTSQAYLDPGTGSYLFQLIIASFLGGLFALKTWWRSIKLFFRRNSRDKKQESITEENDNKENE